jgi:hypothetical protein
MTHNEPGGLVADRGPLRALEAHTLEQVRGSENPGQRAGEVLELIGDRVDQYPHFSFINELEQIRTNNTGGA